MRWIKVVITLLSTIMATFTLVQYTLRLKTAIIKCGSMALWKCRDLFPFDRLRLRPVVPSIRWDGTVICRYKAVRSCKIWEVQVYCLHTVARILMWNCTPEYNSEQLISALIGCFKSCRSLIGCIKIINPSAPERFTQFRDQNSALGL